MMRKLMTIGSVEYWIWVWVSEYKAQIYLQINFFKIVIKLRILYHWLENKMFFQEKICLSFTSLIGRTMFKVKVKFRTKKSQNGQFLPSTGQSCHYIALWCQLSFSLCCWSKKSFFGFIKLYLFMRLLYVSQYIF